MDSSADRHLPGVEMLGIRIPPLSRSRSGVGRGESLLRRLRFKVFERLSTSMWVIPGLCLIGAVVLSWVAGTIDENLKPKDQAWYLFRGGADGARALVSAVATSMITLAGVVFSITILVLQLASNQFSPRVLRTFLKDYGTQVVLGVFVGTFTYALLTLRTIRSESTLFHRQVPALSVWLAVVLAMCCVIAFVYFIHHVAQSIRAVNVIARIAGEAKEHLDKLYPQSVGWDAEDAGADLARDPCNAVIWMQGKAGVIVSVDEDRLWACATEAGVTLRLTAKVGDFVPHGAPLFEIWGDPERVDAQLLEEAISIDVERTLTQDLGFAFRQLVDIAERALSPGINDPTTAVQALDQIHELLRRLARRRFPAPARRDDAGRVRLILPRPDWASYVRLGLEEIREYGRQSIQVTRRIRSIIGDLLEVVPPYRRAPLLEQFELLNARDETAT